MQALASCGSRFSACWPLKTIHPQPARACPRGRTQGPGVSPSQDRHPPVRLPSRDGCGDRPQLLRHRRPALHKAPRRGQDTPPVLPLHHPSTPTFSCFLLFHRCEDARTKRPLFIYSENCLDSLGKTLPLTIHHAQHTLPFLRQDIVLPSWALGRFLKLGRQQTRLP